MTEDAEKDRRVETILVYWGRRGSLSLLTLHLAELLRRRPDLRAAVSYSSSNELASQFAGYPDTAFPTATFRHGTGALTALPGFLLRLPRLLRNWRRMGAKRVVVLMPHVWTPLLTGAARLAGMQTTVVVHDAKRHPGDPTGAAHGWIMSDLGRVDTVVTLSRAVTDRLVQQRPRLAGRVVRLFHPLLGSADPASGGELEQGGKPLRVLWLGRIMAYKGLPLLVEAVGALKRGGASIGLTVAGQGSLAAEQQALDALGARIVNRWLDHEEIANLLAECDVVALPYVAASQSGVVAAALGAGRPVVVTPVGGLPEQVEPGVNGLISARADAPAFADALGLLARDRTLLRRLRKGAQGTLAGRSVEAFLEALVAAGEGPEDGPAPAPTGREVA